MSADAAGAEAQELLSRLVRFNTVNPPGDERAAQEYLADHLQQASTASCSAPSRGGRT
jgi:acetylornithine deacetylase/succinyl-diaminopimelate desuccinylase-like protein